VTAANLAFLAFACVLVGAGKPGGSRGDKTRAGEKTKTSGKGKAGGKADDKTDEKPADKPPVEPTPGDSKAIRVAVLELGTLGMSMGSTMAWWLAALDPRIKVCVDICCLTDYEALIAAGGLDGHGIYYYVPSLLKHFSTSQINALIAPRPHLSLAGELDPLTPPAGLERIDRELRPVYAALGASEAWQLRRYASGHQETPAMRAAVLAFLEKWL